MCIKTVKSIGVEASLDLLKDTVRDLDMGKMLAVAGGVLEADPKALLKKFDLRDEDVRFAALDLLIKLRKTRASVDALVFYIQT